jgi:hypothetical protein
MRSSGVVVLASVCLFLMPAPRCSAGDNAEAAVQLSSTAVHGDTVSFQVLVSSAVKTRVVHLMFELPEGLELVSWEDGEFIPDALRIGPVVDEPTGRVLVALATRSTNVVTESSGQVGTVTLLKTGDGEAQISVVEACLVDAGLCEDWIVTPGNPIQAAPPVREGLSVPDAYALRGASPNPISHETIVRYEIPRPGSEVKIRIYDVRGRRVRTLVDAHTAPGYYSHVWHLKNDQGHRVAPGVYFCRMEAGDFRDTKKLVLLQ